MIELLETRAGEVLYLRAIQQALGADSPLSSLLSVVAWASRLSAALTGVGGSRMSDDSITFVPIDPRFVPSEKQVSDAVGLASQLFSDADDISPIRSERIRLFDCGSNFEAVYCPACGKELDLEWWGDMMDQDFANGGFDLLSLTMPCCGKQFTLNDLRYDWPQAFGLFGLRIRNANVGHLPNETVGQFAALLGGSVRVVYSYV
jgi:hypothetical protein